MPRIILHIDMNSYFASVEQQANPFLRGKPVAVCAYMSDNGCILASSREAKAFGVKTGLTVRMARDLCPQIIILENHPDKYRSVTEQVFGLLAGYTDTLEPYSIDEAFLNLTGLVGNFSEAEKICQEIKIRIKDEIGEWLKASQGLAFTKFLAKFVSDCGPKDSVSIIENITQAEEWFRKVELTAAWGIGDRLKIRLNELGINDLMDLKNYPVTNLRQNLGIMGYYLWANVNGIEIDHVKSKEETLPKSIGHSYCLPKRTTDKDYLARNLMKLCEKTGRRLREQNLEAKSLAIYWSYTAIMGGYGKSFKTQNSFFTTMDIFRKAYGVLKNFPLADKVSMLAVSVSNLIPSHNQLSFLEDRLMKKELNRALDNINDKFGEFTVIYGQMWETGKNAPDRIGFRKSLRPPAVKDTLEYFN